MAEPSVAFTVFTKPWPEMPLPELAKFVKGLGFDGVELPVRPGFQVQPDNVTSGLAEAVKIFGDFGIRIGSVAGSTDEKTFAACAESGVPIVRICVVIPAEMDYLAGVADLQRRWDSLVPLLEKYGVVIGVQNHYGRSIANAMQLHHAISPYNPDQLCAVWDCGHNGLEGEQVDLALDTIWPHLRLVNLKSAYWRRVSPPEADIPEWSAYWTTGRHGRANWPWVARELMRRGYVGDVCLTAEYTDHKSTNRLIAEDIRFARSLFERETL